MTRQDLVEFSLTFPTAYKGYLFDKINPNNQQASGGVRGIDVEGGGVSV